MNVVEDDIKTVIDLVRERWLTADSTKYTADNTVITVDGSGPPFYTYGHRLAIAKVLKEMGKDAVNKFRKYPLFALNMPFPEVRDGSGFVRFRLNIAILMLATKDMNTATRMEVNFKGTLLPLYELFLDRLRDSGLFSWKDFQDVPPHTMIKRPYWGTSTSVGNEQNIFDDYLDAVEIVDLQVNQKIKC